MFKREIKVNFKSFIITLCVIIGIFLISFLVYPTITNSDNIKMMNEMMSVFPKDLLKAFNMDITSIDNIFGWFKTEGIIFLILLTGVYGSILGSNILLKEENDKTIEYLNSLPVTRNKIVLSKVLCAVFYIVLLIVICGIFNYIGLLLSGDFDKKVYILLTVSTLLTTLCIFSVTLLLSTFFNKTKKMIALSLGFVFISYFLSTFSTINNSVEFLKYFTIFTLSDTRNIIVHSQINLTLVLVGVMIFVIPIFLTLKKYNAKELV